MGDRANPADASDQCDQSVLQSLERRLAAETAERERLRKELDVRNCALDAAASHFIIGDVTRPGWPVVYLNRAILRDYGYEPAELLGRGPDILVPHDLNRVQLKSITQALRSGHDIRTELRGRRKDGSILWIGAFIAPVKDAAGQITHYVGVGADITARLEQDRIRRQLQDQLYSEMQERERIVMELRVAQKLESVGRLAAGIAHEINTPIQYIGDGVSFLQSAQTDHEGLLAAYRQALAQLTAGEPLAAVLDSIAEAEKTADLGFLSVEVPKAFERTLEGIERVAAIVRAMKEFAHPDSNEQSPANLNHAIETTLIVAHNEYKYTATVETQLGAMPEVMCNIGELNQVFLNLIVNAAQAIEDAGKDASNGRITISTAIVGDAAVICVADNGCGIPDEHLEKIFDPFFTTKAVGRGTGQGLAIARSIVTEKHRGSIEVQSSAGVGTRFVIRLPVSGRAAPSAKGAKAA